ncbi:MAG: sugar phosphate isomerase/epimerase family protein [bacterium]
MSLIGINIHGSLLKGETKNIKKICNQFSEMGFGCVEFPLEQLGAIIDCRVNKSVSTVIYQILSSYNFKRSLHCGLNLTDPRQTTPKLWKAIIDFANSIDAETLIVHGGEIPPSVNREISPKAYKDIFTRTFHNLATFAEGSGVNISIENAEPRFDERLSDLVNILKGLELKNIGITLDVGHLYLSAKVHGFDLFQAVQEALPFLNHVHLADNFGKTDGLGTRNWTTGLGDLHLPIGWGSVPIKDIIGILKGNYEGAYLLDLHPRFIEFFPESLKRLQNILSSGEDKYLRRNHKI